jgi:hypothetical protein
MLTRLHTSFRLTSHRYTDPPSPQHTASQSHAHNLKDPDFHAYSADQLDHNNQSNPRLRPNPTPKMSSAQTFTTLKSQIISLATALYGTTSTPSQAFDVLPFSQPRLTPNGTPLKSSLTHGAALIYYTGPASSPHVSWEMISYADSQSSVQAGAQRLLEDMQRGVGDVISKSFVPFQILFLRFSWARWGSDEMDEC